MFKLGLALALAAGLALAAPVARAGTYTVVMCGAPGAGGVNNSWVPAKGSFGADPGPFYQHDTSCYGGLAVHSTPQDGLRAPWLTFASWDFTAPAGTEITRVTAWRHGEARDDREENGADDDHWRVYAQDDKGNQLGGGFGGDTCGHGNGVAMCTIGAQGGVSDASRSEHRVVTSRVSWGALCGGTMTDGCQTSFGIPLVSLFLYGAAVELTDTSLPSVAAGGALLAGGWRSPQDPVTVDATDNAGVRSAVVQVDGRPVDRADLPWRTFATARARGSAALWRARYAFSGRSGSYPVRARIRREAAFPFDLGYSRPVVVRVAAAVGPTR